MTGCQTIIKARLLFDIITQRAFILTSFIGLIPVEYLFNDYRRDNYSESSD